MAKKYFWLKLKSDFFTSKAMKKLRKIAGGDTYTIIYLKLQLLSLKDEGVLFYEGIEPTFYEELALELDEDAENVQATLIFLENARLLEVRSESEYVLTQVPYLIGGEGESAERVRRFRRKNLLDAPLTTEQKALHCNGNVTESNANVTKCNTEIDIEIDKEIDIEIEKSKREIKEGEKPKRKRFVKPTLEELQAYAMEIGFNLDAQHFLNHYDANGWKVGKGNSMKDWKAAVRTWRDREKKWKNEPVNQKAQELEQLNNMGFEWARGGSDV